MPLFNFDADPDPTLHFNTVPEMNLLLLIKAIQICDHCVQTLHDSILSLHVSIVSVHGPS